MQVYQLYFHLFIPRARRRERGHRRSPAFIRMSPHSPEIKPRPLLRCRDHTGVFLCVRSWAFQILALMTPSVFDRKLTEYQSSFCSPLYRILEEGGATDTDASQVRALPRSLSLKLSYLSGILHSTWKKCEHEQLRLPPKSHTLPSA